jgi:hypothetical protein
MNRTLGFHTGLLASLFAGLFGLTTAAQQEQWLDYHTSSEPRGYHWLELSTSPPPNVRLPKLRASAFYGRWTNGLDGGRWFCLDRASKSAACDRIFFDSNGSGRLDDKPAVSATRREANMAYFNPLKVTFNGEDGPITYHLMLSSYQFGASDARLLVSAGCWYEGTVTLGGKKRHVQLFDENANGCFNDQGIEASGSDRLVITGEKGRGHYLGRFLEVDGGLFRLEVARDGAYIKAAKAEGVTFGSVHVPEALSEIEVVGECGDFVRKPAKGEFTLPAGKYRVQNWTLNRKDTRGALWTLSGSGVGHDADFEVTAATAATLNVGESVRPLVTATETKTQVSFNLQLRGLLGETVEIMRGNTRPRAPQLHLASLTGNYRSTNTFEYG